jgi:hypothetical protein
MEWITLLTLVILLVAIAIQAWNLTLMYRNLQKLRRENILGWMLLAKIGSTEATAALRNDYPKKLVRRLLNDEEFAEYQALRKQVIPTTEGS